MPLKRRVEFKKGRFLGKHQQYFYLHREAEVELLLWTGKRDPLLCTCKKGFASRIPHFPQLLRSQKRSIECRGKSSAGQNISKYFMLSQISLVCSESNSVTKNIIWWPQISFSLYHCVYAHSPDFYICQKKRQHSAGAQIHSFLHCLIYLMHILSLSYVQNTIPVMGIQL